MGGTEREDVAELTELYASNEDEAAKELEEAAVEDDKYSAQGEVRARRGHRHLEASGRPPPPPLPPAPSLLHLPHPDARAPLRLRPLLLELRTPPPDPLQAAFLLSRKSCQPDVQWTLMRALALLTPASAEELKDWGGRNSRKLTWAQFAEAIGKFDILSVCACPSHAISLPASLPPSPPLSVRDRNARPIATHPSCAVGYSNDDDDLVLLEPPRAPTWKS